MKLEKVPISSSLLPDPIEFHVYCTLVLKKTLFKLNKIRYEFTGMNLVSCQRGCY